MLERRLASTHMDGFIEAPLAVPLSLPRANRPASTSAFLQACKFLRATNSRRYVDFSMHRVRMMKYFGVTPYLVFDGDFLPSKASEEASRAKRREESKRAGMELLKAGKTSQAYLDLQKAIDVTPEMARHLIEELKTAGVSYVVAPYEADAQLVYLERQGIINGIISEDSDLLVFGAKRLLTKLDQHGQCIEINRRDFCAVREVSLTGWTDAEFRQMAIMSGCDYLGGVNNMGLKTAYRMIRKYKTPERVVRMLQFEGKYRFPDNYLAAFKQAELTFLHQRVFCPKQQQLVFLTEPDSSHDIEQMPFIGAAVETDLARAIAAGDVNPITKEKIILSRLPEKRRNSQAAPPAAAQSRPPGKPINSYFEGHRRIPLGEMDPNCFVVEPGQVRNLAENSLPRVFPLPRPYVDGAQEPSRPPRPYAAPRLRRRTEPVSRVLIGLADPDTQSQSRRRTEGPTARSIDGAGYQKNGHPTRPSKKARLCEEVTLQAEPNREPERSKFFPVKTTQRTTKPELHLLSDDSIEDALLDLPDVDGWQPARPPKGVAKLEIFEEKTAQEMGCIAAEAKDDRVIPNSDIEVPVSSPVDRVFQSEAHEASPCDTPARGSLRQFTYTPLVAKPASPLATRIAHGLPTPASSMQKPTASQGRVREFHNTPMPTPLQRIGAQAFQRGKGSFTPPLSPRSSGAKNEHRRRSYASLPVNPSFVPLPKVDLAEVEALNTTFGSEDQIIPDSDGENDLEADIADTTEEQELAHGSKSRSRLNLSRFLHA